MTYPIIDVSHWKEDADEYGQGEREKKWLVNPDSNKLAMLKFPREGRGEHWAEKLCSEFAKVLAFPCAEVELAVFDALVGNGDRHQDNWGITRHEQRDELTISPLSKRISHTLCHAQKKYLTEYR